MDDLSDLLTDWRRSLTARNRAPRTIADYLKTGALFVACAAFVMRWLGYPVPGLSELQEYLGGVRYLSDLLS